LNRPRGRFNDTAQASLKWQRPQSRYSTRQRRASPSSQVFRSFPTTSSGGSSWPTASLTVAGAHKHTHPSDGRTCFFFTRARLISPSARWTLRCSLVGVCATTWRHLLPCESADLMPFGETCEACGLHRSSASDSRPD
jgi:hypothetical protein